MNRTRLIILAVLIWAGMPDRVAANERLDLLKNVSAAGAPTLTLKMLDQAQPKVDVDLYEWILWEQERFSILSQWRQWDELLVRVESLPDDIPDQFKDQASTYKVMAYLELGQTLTARKILRQLVWQSGAGTSSEYEIWRRLIINSYLRDGRTNDARIAMLRFDQDFDSSDIEWILLRSRVLIESGRHDQAIQILQHQDHWKARVTSLLAQFQQRQIDAAELWEYVDKRSKETSDPEELASLWALGFHASRNMSPVDKVVALESLFRIGIGSPLELFQVPVDSLWQAYIEYATLVGNRSELLLGDDENWLTLAENASNITPVKARSLFALLIARSPDSDIVDRAASGYMQTFAEIDEAERILLDNLFNQSQAFSSADKIPPLIRYQLVDLALRSADIEEATRLMSGLTTTPQGTSQFNWQLRQSRVLILGGRYDEGNQVLQSLILAYQEPTKEDTDRILQVLFDMQTVNLHEQAIAHLNQLISLEIDAKQRREILYWIADSYHGLEKYDQAAVLYLQSAMLPGTDAMDPWAQTARYHAAENLQKSGLIDDARRIYQDLLRVAQDPAQRSLLSHNIQQLWLTQNIQ